MNDRPDTLHRAARVDGPAPSLHEAIQSLAHADRLLVALDFDGTLAPFVDQPLAARALPAAMTAITRLESLPETWVAYISGRPLSSLEAVTEADEHALLVGSHGVEVRFGVDGEDLDLTEDERSRLGKLGTLLGEVAALDPRIRLERKPVGFGVHTRLLDPEAAATVNAAAYAAAKSVGGELTVRDGKDIVEFSVREANKGDGVERLRAHLGATGVLFAGDDVTDEDGFAVLTSSDVGVKVGPGETAARYRVADPNAVAALLSQLADIRASRSA